MALLPWRRAADRREAARLASAQEFTPAGSPVDRMGSRAVDPKQSRARMFAREIGWVGNSFRFEAHQASRCPLRPERTTNGVDWEPIPADLEPGDPDYADSALAWQVLRAIRPHRGEQADLVRTAVYLDETEGEYWIVADPPRPDGTPAYSARSVVAVARRKDGPGFLVQTTKGGKIDKGTAFATASAWRHWQPSSEWEDVATSSLISMVGDVETYWTLSRRWRRETRSRLAANGMFWTPSSAHGRKRIVDGRPTEISEMDYAYTRIAQRKVNDEFDLEVSSVAPFPINTPGDEAIPAFLEFPVDATFLDQLRHAEEMVANGLPLSTTSILDAQSTAANHWNQWAGDDADVEVVETTLSRTLGSLTAATYRPTLEALASQGYWHSDPTEWRIGADMDPIKARPDNAVMGLALGKMGAIKVDSMLDACHFKETDKAEPEDLLFYATLAKLIPQGAVKAGSPNPNNELGLGSEGGGPQMGRDVPGEPPAIPVQTASLRLIDDLDLLG